MNRKKIESAVGDTTHAAADLGKEALAQAAVYLQQAQEYLAPRAQGAFSQAQEYLTPLAKDAAQRGAKLAASAVDAARPALDEALDKVSPAVETAYQRVAPVIDEARGKVQHGLLPWISDILHEAAEGAAKVELPAVPEHLLPEPEKKRSAWSTIGLVLLAGGLLAGIAYAVKKFLAPSDSGWQAHEPSSPYVRPTVADVVDDLSEKAEEAADAASAWIKDSVDAAGDAVDDLKEKAADAVDAVKDKAADLVDDATDKVDEIADAAADAAEDDADPFVDSPYGAGSYVGSEPPEGFVIKGNERSMKYHVQGNGGYERTIADVWFAGEDAAEAAGFTRAKR